LRPRAARAAWAIAPILFFDALLFSVLAPLLPHYEETLGLSSASAGVLAATFPAGTVLTALPAGALANRIGGKPALLLGMLILAVASAAFGLSESILPLDAARFLQGAAGSVIWAGGLTWATASTPPERRATVIGNLLGIGIGGALFGPLLGALAVATEPTVVFGAMPLVLGLLALYVAAAPGVPPSPEPASLALALRAPFRRPTLAAAGVIFAPSIALGMMFVLGSLRLAAAGAAAGAIAAVFVASAAAEASATPVAGRLADRLGTRPILLAALLYVGLLYAVFAFVGTAVALAVAVVAISAGLGFCWSPGTVRLHDAVGRAGAGESHAFALFNLVWAGGQMLGSAAGGSLAQLGGDALPCILMSLTLFLAIGLTNIRGVCCAELKTTEAEVA
jgi:MFS family permease